MITRRAVILLGLSQLICWGISFYLIGVFGELMVADLGWSRALVFGGYSAAILAMGLASPLVGRWIDRAGGGRVMAGGSILCAVGCAGLALAHTPAVYYAAWVCIGLAMRATLYDAAFAALARIAGPAARRPMSQITLLGGLASTCFWPIGHALADPLGWRGALLVYAAIALAAVPLHLALPAGRHQGHAPSHHPSPPVPSADRGPRKMTAALLYATVVAGTNGLNSGMSAHMIGMLTDLGLAAAAAVSIGALRGIGQTTARLAEILSGSRLGPAELNLVAAAVLPLCFTLCLVAGGHVMAAAAFAFVYGAGNGILSITRGTLPLVLFDSRTYGAFVGALLVPSFMVSAASPLAFAAVIEHGGARGALVLSIALSGVVFAASVALKMLNRNDPVR